MFNDIKDKLSKIADFYDDFPEKKEELKGYKHLLDNYEIITSLVENKYLADFLAELDGRVKEIDAQIIYLARNPTKNNDEIVMLMGEKEAIRRLLNRLEIPNIDLIEKVIEEELNYLKENGRTI